MAHCKLPAQNTSIAIKHKTVEEIWYFTKGIGEMWLKEKNGHEHVFKIEKGVSLTVPKGTSFQFRVTTRAPAERRPAAPTAGSSPELFFY